MVEIRTLQKRKPETIWFSWTLTTREFIENIRTMGAVSPGFLGSCVLISGAIKDHSLKMHWPDDLWSPFQLWNYSIMATPVILGRWYLSPWSTAKLTDSLGGGSNDSVLFTINSVNWNNHLGLPAASKCSLPEIYLYSVSEELLWYLPLWPSMFAESSVLFQGNWYVRIKNEMEFNCVF